MSTTCQLDALSRENARHASLRERVHTMRRNGRKVLVKLRSFADEGLDYLRTPRLGDIASSPKRLPLLDLQPGEHVRVKSLKEIESTLDAHGAYERCYFVHASMAEYCGRTFKVLKRVESFYDERHRRMCKAKNLVLLDGAHCRGMPAAGFEEEWKGCDRMCFVFWKEAWLERAGAFAE